MKKNPVGLRECVNNDFIEINSFGHLEQYFVFKKVLLPFDTIDFIESLYLNY